MDSNPISKEYYERADALEKQKHEKQLNGLKFDLEFLNKECQLHIDALATPNLDLTTRIEITDRLMRLSSITTNYEKQLAALEAQTLTLGNSNTTA